MLRIEDDASASFPSTGSLYGIYGNLCGHLGFEEPLIPYLAKSLFGGMTFHLVFMLESSYFLILVVIKYDKGGSNVCPVESRLNQQESPDALQFKSEL
ncbi:hypothetical protein TNCV_469571 [Trichonephila clavipes]|nr:hypothetical protein TNCV_469571 [Trichonephila clavipes]